MNQLLRILLCCLLLAASAAPLRAESRTKELIARADSLQDKAGQPAAAIEVFKQAERQCLTEEGEFCEDMKYILGCLATCAQMVDDYDLYINSLVKLDRVSAKIGYFEEVSEEFLCYEIAAGLLSGEVDDDDMARARDYIARGKSKALIPGPEWQFLMHKFDYLEASALPNLEEAAPRLKEDYEYFLYGCPFPREEMAGDLLSAALCWSSNLMHRTLSQESLDVLDRTKSELLKTDPNFYSLQLEVDRTYALANLDRNQEVIDLGNQLLTSTPEDEVTFTFLAAVKYNMGRCYNSLGEHEKALQSFQSIFKSPYANQLEGVDTDFVNVEVAVAYAGMGKNKEAEELAKEILRHNPQGETLLTVYWLLGILANDRGSTIEVSFIEDLIDAFDRAEYQNPGFASALVEYARKFISFQMYESALSAVNKALQIYERANETATLDYFNALCLKAAIVARFDDLVSYGQCMQTIMANNDQIQRLLADSQDYEAMTFFAESLFNAMYIGFGVAAYEYQQSLAAGTMTEADTKAAGETAQKTKQQIIDQVDSLNEDVIKWLQENNPDRLGALYHNCALLLRDLKEYDEGIAYIDRVLPMVPKDCEMHGVIDELRSYLALHKEGPKKHIPFISNKFAQDKDRLRTLLNGLASKRRSEMWQQFYGNINNYVEYASQAADAPELTRIAYDAILLSKGLLLQSEVDFSSRILKSGNPELIEKYRRWTALQQSNPQEADRLEREIVRELDVDFQSDLFTCSWADVKRALRPGEYAVEFRSLDDYGTRRYLAFLLGADSKAPQVIEVCTSKDLDAVGQGDDFNYEQLSRLVWGRLADALPAGSKVYFSPDMQLHSFPLENLPDFEDVNRLISQRWDLRRVSSTRLLTQSPAKSKSHGVEIYGGFNYSVDAKELKDDYQANSSEYRAVDFDSDALRGTISSVSDLPGSKREVVQIVDLLHGRKVPVKEYSGAKGTESKFKATAGRAGNVLHLTTHGFYIAPNSGGSRISNILGLSGEFETYEDALQRSGLMMAGVNETIRGRVKAGECEDGLLTAKEISGLNLDRIDLAILSACETGVGAISGDGVFGLQRGFKLAGAKSIMMTLWKVNDAATERLMVEFYKNRLAGASTRDALAAAQETVRTTPGWENPKYWAAFILLDSPN